MEIERAAFPSRQIRSVVCRAPLQVLCQSLEVGHVSAVQALTPSIDYQPDLFGCFQAVSLFSVCIFVSQVPQSNLFSAPVGIFSARKRVSTDQNKWCFHQLNPSNATSTMDFKPCVFCFSFVVALPVRKRKIMWHRSLRTLVYIYFYFFSFCLNFNHREYQAVRKGYDGRFERWCSFCAFLSTTTGGVSFVL